MSEAIQNAALMAVFHNRFRIVPNYEDILEATYTLFIRKGHVVVDIGAHTGRHTKVFSELVGKEGVVHAFEPLPYAFDILKNRGLSHNVHLHNYAIGEKSGTVSFVFAQGAPEESGFRLKIYNDPSIVVAKEIKVEARRLDEFLKEIGRVDFIKIDAEGAEIECMRSGGQMINAHRPFITVEYGYPSYSAYGNNAASLFNFAVSMGYVVGDMFGAYCSDLSTWSQVCDVAYWDWFLIPLERVDEWRSTIRP